MGVSWPSHGKMDDKLKSENVQKRAVFYVYDNILRTIRAGRWRERRYADHIFIQMYFRMHHFVVKFSQVSSPQAAKGHWPPNQDPANVPVRIHSYSLVGPYIYSPSSAPNFRFKCLFLCVIYFLVAEYHPLIACSIFLIVFLCVCKFLVYKKFKLY